MRKKKITFENYLDNIPKINTGLGWKTDENGIVTLEKANKGIFNVIAQKLFKKPEISYIHLDELGSCVWLKIDGKSNIYEIGKKVKVDFGVKAEPLYERLAKYFSILESYGFVMFN